MNESEQRQDGLVRLLAPRYDVPSDPDGPAARELLRAIVAQPRPRKVTRRPLIAVAAAAVLTGGVLVASTVVPWPGAEPAQAHALEIVRTDRYIEIRIVDPEADKARYQAELAANGLDIVLELAPVSRPDQVGRVIFEEQMSPEGPQIETIEAPGACATSEVCPVGIRVPLDFTSSARVVFGREARPGEQPVISDEAPTGPIPDRSR